MKILFWISAYVEDETHVQQSTKKSVSPQQNVILVSLRLTTQQVKREQVKRSPRIEQLNDLKAEKQIYKVSLTCNTTTHARHYIPFNKYRSKILAPVYLFSREYASMVLQGLHYIYIYIYIEECLLMLNLQANWFYKQIRRNKLVQARRQTKAPSPFSRSPQTRKPRPNSNWSEIPDFYEI